MNVKNICLFVGGLIIGGAAGISFTKKYYQEKYQKQYEEDYAALEKYYQRVDEYARDLHEDEELFEDDGVNSPEVDSRPGGRMSDEERAEIKKKLNDNCKRTTNYAEMYQNKRADTERDLAESEHPLDDDEESEVVTPEEEAFDDHQKNKNKPPRIISSEDYSNLPAHIEQNVLYFYAYDEVLCDENEEAIDEPALLIGDALTKYDFIDSKERVIFVMNYALDTCYEIQKIDASWTDSH